MIFATTLDEGESLSAIKRRYQQGQQDDGAPQEYSSESEEDNTKDIERAKSVAEAKMISSGEDSEQEVHNL
jgi:hypothetical protein